MVWIECHMSPLTPFQEGTHYKLLRNLNSASKVSRYSEVEILTLHTQFQFDSSLSFKLDAQTI